MIAKCSDYLANSKIPLKDIATLNEFLEVFKWDTLPTYKDNLGASSGIITECIDSEIFWDKLKESHQELKKKY